MANSNYTPDSQSPQDSPWQASVDARKAEMLAKEQSASQNGHHPTSSTGPKAPGWNEWQERNDPDGLKTLLALIERTDMGNAQRFIAIHEKNVLYCAPQKAWYIWDGRRWAKDETVAIQRLAKEAIIHIGLEQEMAAKIRGADHEEVVKLAKWAIQSQNVTRVEAAIKLSRDALAVSPLKFDSDPWLLNCLNGTLNIQTGELQPHNPEDFITKLVPVAYDPDAFDQTWTDFLAATLPDPDALGFVQRSAGYSLSGDTTEECMFFPYGPTRTGKSTFLRALLTVMGDYGTVLDFTSLAHKKDASEKPRNDLAKLWGKRFVVSIEVEKGQRLAESVLKAITGRDVITARFLHQEFFDYTPSFKLWLAANDRPSANPDDDATWRRIHQIPFDQQVAADEVDPSLKTYLTEEEGPRSAILNWMMAGFRAWQRRGIDIPDVVKQTTQEYREEVDIVAQFLCEACESTEGESCFNSRLYQTFTAFCKYSGIRNPISMRAVTKSLRVKGFHSDRSNVGVRWYGLKLTANPSDFDAGYDRESHTDGHRF